MATLSRQLAQWVVGLRYEDLPSAVVDRAKGVTLHNVASILVGAQTAPGKQAVALVTDEEAGVRTGATIMVDGTKVTKGGAAYANSEMALAGGKFDSFRMLTHPGTSIIPGSIMASGVLMPKRCFDRQLPISRRTAGVPGSLTMSYAADTTGICDKNRR